MTPCKCSYVNMLLCLYQGFAASECLRSLKVSADTINGLGHGNKTVQGMKIQGIINIRLFIFSWRSSVSLADIKTITEGFYQLYLIQ